VSVAVAVAVGEASVGELVVEVVSPPFVVERVVSKVVGGELTRCSVRGGEAGGAGVVLGR
jgi:hypothetical protein